MFDRRGFAGGCFLEIVAVNFLLLEKTVSFGAVVHKRCLKTWFDSGDNTFVDIAMCYFSGSTLDAEFLEFVIDNFCDSDLLGIDGIDENFAGHERLSFSLLNPVSKVCIMGLA